MSLAEIRNKALGGTEKYLGFLIEAIQKYPTSDYWRIKIPSSLQDEFKQQVESQYKDARVKYGKDGVIYKGECGSEYRIYVGPYCDVRIAKT